MSRTVEVERHSRRWFLKWLAIGGAAVAAAGVGEKIYVENEVRSQLLPPGELSPELRIKLTELTDANAKYLVVDVDGWTSERLREAGVAVPDFPVTLPDEETDPKTTPSSYRWLAVRPAGIYLPREDDDTAGDLASDITAANRAANTFDTKLRFVEGTLSDFIEAEIASLRETGQSLFQAGFVATRYRVEVDGVNTGLAIGKDKPEDPAISIITFDATREAPLPPNISAGGFIVAK